MPPLELPDEVEPAETLPVIAALPECDAPPDDSALPAAVLDACAEALAAPCDDAWLVSATDASTPSTIAAPSTQRPVASQWRCPVSQSASTSHRDGGRQATL